jgi:hypothetical protein
MAPSEADVIQAFVRHNLTVLDGMTVVDHRSTDATPAILQALRDEGLRLTIGTDHRVGFFQDVVMTETVRATLAATGADFVFALDAESSCSTRRPTGTPPTRKGCRRTR